MSLPLRLGTTFPMRTTPSLLALLLLLTASAVFAADFRNVTCDVQWGIRTPDIALIGACGFESFQVGKLHRAAVGYWLAKPFWGRGTMTAVVHWVCQHAFEEFGLVKVTAHVFSHNPASARVLEKCGFQQEGFLRKHFLKDGQFIDARQFALLKGD